MKQCSLSLRVTWEKGGVAGPEEEEAPVVLCSWKDFVKEKALLGTKEFG